MRNDRTDNEDHSNRQPRERERTKYDERRERKNYVSRVEQRSPNKERERTSPYKRMFSPLFCPMNLKKRGQQNATTEKGLAYTHVHDSRVGPIARSLTFPEWAVAKSVWALMLLLLLLPLDTTTNKEWCALAGNNRCAARNCTKWHHPCGLIWGLVAELNSPEKSMRHRDEWAGMAAFGSIGLT